MSAIVNGNNSTITKVTATTNLNGGSPSNKSVSSLNNGTSHNGTQQQQQTNGNGNGHVNGNGIGAGKHWSQRKHESCISSQCVEKSSFLSKLRGGSDSGQFIYLDSSLITTNSSLPMDTSMGKIFFC
jgi:hypothetical protein